MAEEAEPAGPAKGEVTIVARDEGVLVFGERADVDRYIAGLRSRGAREVDRLMDAGLLESELRSGRRTVWAATDSAIFDELRSILLKTIGPEAVLEKRFTGLARVDRA